MKVVAQEDAIAVAHGCTGKGNDQVRFDIAMSSIDPSIKIIAPIREMNLTRDLEIKYAKKIKFHLMRKSKNIVLT